MCRIYGFYEMIWKDMNIILPEMQMEKSCYMLLL